MGFYNLFVNLCSMALAPLIVGKMADRYNLITALHVPIVAQLVGAALFIVVIQCIRRNGLRHPVLAHHWIAESRGALATTIALETECSSA